MNQDTELIVRKNALLYGVYWLYLIVVLVMGAVNRVPDTPWIAGIMLSAIVPMTVLLLLRKFLRLQMFLNIAVLSAVLVVINLTAVKPNGPYLSNYIFLWLVLLSGLMYQRYSTVLFASAMTILVQVYLYLRFRDGLLSPIGPADFILVCLFTGVVTLIFLFNIRHYHAVRAADEETKARLETANRRFENELRLASQIQSRFLTREIEHVPGYEFTVAYRPALIVGGDFCRVEPLPDRRHAVILADISGHGQSAAIITTVIYRLFLSCVQRHSRPEDMAKEISSGLFTMLKGSLYATAVILVLEPGGSDIPFCSAGHCPILVYRARSGGLNTFASTGPPLGLFETDEFSGGNLTLEAGDFLVLQTDGLMESANARHEFFGLNRIRETVSEGARSGLEGVTRTLLERAEIFRGQAANADDITLLLVRKT